MTDFDSDINPIENGVQQAYQEIRGSLELILMSEVLHLALNGLPSHSAQEQATETLREVLVSLDDAVSNNWDELMLSFWKGVKQDVELMEADG